MHAARFRCGGSFSAIRPTILALGSGALLVAGRADPRVGPMDQSADHRGAYGAPLASLDSPHSVSRTIRIRPTESNLARFSACGHRRRGCAFLPAPWIRL